jgi:signal transduction histidine kinase
MTDNPPSEAPRPAPPLAGSARDAPRGRRRGRLMRRLAREYAYVLTGAFLAVPTFVLSVLALVFAALSLLTIGLPFLAGALWLARRAITYFRAPARRLLGWDWPSPRPVDLIGLVRDPAGWKALAYCFLTFPVKLSAAYIGGTLLVLGAFFVTYPLWWVFAPDAFGLLEHTTWAGTWWLAAQAVLALLVAPWFVRSLVWLDRVLAYALLTPSRDRERIAALEAGRAALQSDAAALLRRVERDLHDGTQARLVALGVTLSRIERRAENPEVRELVRGGQAAIAEALTELRDIVRGLHPPALDDGLEVALGTLAARSAVPVRVNVALDGRPPDATASAVYFTVAELLTNVARHAGASRAWVDLREDGPWLRLAVRDDGRGGADPSPSGTGLSGLARRAVALDGTLDIDSPPGGPTAVTVTFRRG